MGVIENIIESLKNDQYIEELSKNRGGIYHKEDDLLFVFVDEVDSCDIEFVDRHLDILVKNGNGRTVVGLRIHSIQKSLDALGESLYKILDVAEEKNLIQNPAEKLGYEKARLIAKEIPLIKWN
ncbi:MAG: hypothetical protein COU07_00420 [Candidatus Harrisonbacteria bacterium CG10_big_fil_rev_8_21_14_0_10_40_38]|uniref:Uncharacterized protein n=1 Tax=Candidatus Harrisonbacteria bacterium CG10_big_fil_rev_8_21_14_0_10_40_38 TaxID=1974583 RepID=A0A2H0USG0_9BACT|nr:MAG: hypothetical protein COU07_00420 [Candidatus Harrisonbacteria bacterium CG10_big_fil_rev_8_21_14_0_10_40_38]